MISPIRSFAVTSIAAASLIVLGLLSSNAIVISCEGYETNQQCAARAAALVN